MSAPDGFHVLRVIVTDKELKELLREGRADMTLRVRAGLPPQAHGLKAALMRAQREAGE